MLLREDGGGNQHGDLLAVHNRLERGAQRDFGLAVAHIAAHQPVHWLDRFHIGFHIGDSGALVGGFFKGKRLFQFGLPLGVGDERVAVNEFAGGVEGEQFGRHFAGGALRALLGATPFLRSQSRQAWRAAHRRDVRRYAVKVFQRHIEFVAGGVLYKQVFAVGVVAVDAARDAVELANAVFYVNHIVAGGEFG